MTISDTLFKDNTARFNHDFVGNRGEVDLRITENHTISQDTLLFSSVETMLPLELGMIFLSMLND